KGDHRTWSRAFGGVCDRGRQVGRTRDTCWESTAALDRIATSDAPERRANARCAQRTRAGRLPGFRRSRGDLVGIGRRSKQRAERAVRAGSPPWRLIVSQRLMRQKDGRTRAVLSELEQVGRQVFAVPEAILLELADGRNSGLMFGLCVVPEQPTLQKLRERAQADGAPIVVLVDVEEPGNVGALIRTALAAGAVGLVAAGSSDAYHPKAVRTSMGSVFKLPICREFELEP